MRKAIWSTNKFTNHSSIFIERDDSTDDRQSIDKIDLFGNTIDQQIFSLANVVSSYGITNIKVDKDYLVFEAPLNQLLIQNYNYNESVKLEELN